MVPWVPLFLEEQGCKIKENIVCQDNQSAILLENNGKKSSSKHARHLNVRFCVVMDRQKHTCGWQSNKGKTEGEQTPMEMEQPEDKEQLLEAL